MQRQHFIIASHDSDRSEFQTLREMHGADSNLTRCGFHMMVQVTGSQVRTFRSRIGSGELSRRADKNCNFVWLAAGFNSVGKPPSYHSSLLFTAVAYLNLRLRSIEEGNRALALLGVAIYIRDLCSEQPIGLRTNLPK